MRKVIWFVAVMAALLLGGPPASAHPGHAHALAAGSAHAGAAAGQTRLTAGHEKSQAPCDCPCGHRACSGDCAACCLGVAAILNADLAFPSGRAAFDRGPARFGRSWLAGAEPEPPRPSA